jgi:hypothetical protein
MGKRGTSPIRRSCSQDNPETMKMNGEGAKVTAENMIFFYVFAGLCFLWAVGYQQPYIWVDYMWGRWCKYPATVTAIDIKYERRFGREGGVSLEGKSNGFFAHVSYEYKVNGKAYEGTEHTLPYLFFAKEEWARDHLRGLRAGDVIEVSARCNAPHEKAHFKFETGWYLFKSAFWFSPSIALFIWATIIRIRLKHGGSER